MVEKILYKFKKFIDFNEYFFIMKQKEISDEDFDNIREKENGKEKISKKEKEEKNQRKLLEGKEEVKKKEKEKKNKEEMKKKSKEIEKSQKRIKKCGMKNPNEKRSNSMSIIPNLDSYKYNLNIHAEEEYKKIKRNSCFYSKKTVRNFIFFIE